MADAVYVIGRATGPFFIGLGPPDRDQLIKRLHPQARGEDYELFLGKGITPDDAKMVHMLARERAAFIAIKGEGWYDARMDAGVECVRWAYDTLADEPQPRSYSQAIAILRKEMGLSGAGFARLLGVDRSTPRRLESGRLQMTLEHYARLRWWCQRLGFSSRFEELFPLAGDAVPAHLGSIHTGEDAA